MLPAKYTTKEGKFAKEVGSEEIQFGKEMLKDIKRREADLRKHWLQNRFWFWSQVTNIHRIVIHRCCGFEGGGSILAILGLPILYGKRRPEEEQFSESQ